MIIRENIPQELPPDVVRCDSKASDDINSLQLDLSNIRQRFESGSEEKSPISSLSDRSALQRSESLSVRLKRYQSAISGERRMSDNLNEDSSADSSDEEGDLTLIRESKQKEKVPFIGLSSLKSQWEKGSIAITSEESPKDDDTKEELYKLRQRICLGRSASMRQVYEKACTESVISPRSEMFPIESSVKANCLKEKFEKGIIENETEDEKMDQLRKEKQDDLSVVSEADTAAREAKNIFKQMDASLSKSNTNYNLYASNSFVSNGLFKPVSDRSSSSNNNSSNSNNSIEIVKCSDPNAKEEVHIETSQLQERFKFFQCYKEEEKENRRFEMTPPRDLVDSNNVKVEIRPDANIIKNHNSHEEVLKIDTTSKMLSKFKQLENQCNLEPVLQTGPKPLKRITPPREFTKDIIENELPVERDPNIIKSSYKNEDIIPIEPKLARSLTAKFENWATIEVEKENKRNTENLEEDMLPQIDITKNLRAKFEAIKDDYNKPIEKTKPRVNRFVNELGGINGSEACTICGKRLYPMEKMEFTGMKMHKNCFKCSHCSSALRLENYTLAAGKFFCIVHFKQLFMAKGNYEEGFGVEQHKEKWKNRSSKSSSRNITPDPDESHGDDYVDDIDANESINIYQMPYVD